MFRVKWKHRKTGEYGIAPFEFVDTEQEKIRLLNMFNRKFGDKYTFEGVTDDTDGNGTHSAHIDGNCGDNLAGRVNMQPYKSGNMGITIPSVQK